MAGDTVRFGGFDTWVFGAVPTDGVNSLKRGLDGEAAGVGTASPTNFAGQGFSTPSVPLSTWHTQLLMLGAVLSATAIVSCASAFFLRNFFIPDDSLPSTSAVAESKDAGRFNAGGGGTPPVYAKPDADGIESSSYGGQLVTLVPTTAMVFTDGSRLPPPRAAARPHPAPGGPPGAPPPAPPTTVS